MDLRQTRPETQKKKEKNALESFREKKMFSTHLGSRKKNGLYKTFC